MVSERNRENLSPGCGQRYLYFLLKQEVLIRVLAKISPFFFLLLKTSFLRLFEILDLFLISVFKIINTMAIRDGELEFLLLITHCIFNYNTLRSEVWLHFLVHL